MSETQPDTQLFPQVGDLCYHYKHDPSDLLHQAYQIVNIAKHTETGEELVVYKALYDTSETLFISQEKLEYFARPYSMFVERVLVDGVSVPRFSKITERDTLFAIRKALLGK
jgi:hypothetical protein